MPLPVRRPLAGDKISGSSQGVFGGHGCHGGVGGASGDFNSHAAGASASRGPRNNISSKRPEPDQTEAEEEPEAEALPFHVPDVRRTCPSCGRKFNPDSFERHRRVCRQVFCSKRPTFDAMKGSIIISKGSPVLAPLSSPPAPAQPPRARRGTEPALQTQKPDRPDLARAGPRAPSTATIAVGSSRAAPVASGPGPGAGGALGAAAGGVVPEPAEAMSTEEEIRRLLQHLRHQVEELQRMKRRQDEAALAGGAPRETGSSSTDLGDPLVTDKVINTFLATVRSEDTKERPLWRTGDTDSDRLLQAHMRFDDRADALIALAVAALKAVDRPRGAPADQESGADREQDRNFGEPTPPFSGGSGTTSSRATNGDFSQVSVPEFLSFRSADGSDRGFSARVHTSASKLPDREPDQDRDRSRDQDRDGRAGDSVASHPAARDFASPRQPRAYTDQLSVPPGLRPCPHCGRLFRRGAFDTHEKICRSVFPMHDSRARPASLACGSSGSRGRCRSLEVLRSPRKRSPRPASFDNDELRNLREVGESAGLQKPCRSSTPSADSGSNSAAAQPVTKQSEGFLAAPPPQSSSYPASPRLGSPESRHRTRLGRRESRHRERLGSPGAPAEAREMRPHRSRYESEQPPHDVANRPYDVQPGGARGRLRLGRRKEQRSVHLGRPEASPRPLETTRAPQEDVQTAARPASTAAATGSEWSPQKRIWRSMSERSIPYSGGCAWIQEQLSRDVVSGASSVSANNSAGSVGGAVGGVSGPALGAHVGSAAGGAVGGAVGGTAATPQPPPPHSTLQRRFDVGTAAGTPQPPAPRSAVQTPQAPAPNSAVQTPQPPASRTVQGAGPAIVTPAWVHQASSYSQCSGVVGPSLTYSASVPPRSGGPGTLGAGASARRTGASAVPPSCMSSAVPTAADRDSTVGSKYDGCPWDSDKDVMASPYHKGASPREITAEMHAFCQEDRRSCLERARFRMKAELLSPVTGCIESPRLCSRVGPRPGEKDVPPLQTALGSQAPPQWVSSHDRVDTSALMTSAVAAASAGAQGSGAPLRERKVKPSSRTSASSGTAATTQLRRCRSTDKILAPPAVMVISARGIRLDGVHLKRSSLPRM